MRKRAAVQEVESARADAARSWDGGLVAVGLFCYRHQQTLR